MGLLLFSLFDLVLTILRQDGPGVLSAQATSRLWMLLSRARARGWLSHRQMSYASPLFLLLMLLFWGGTTWLAWTLIFSGCPGALLDAESGEPASLEARWFSVGQVLSTMGTPQVEADGGLWQTALALCGLNGFFLLTLSVAYLLPLFQAGTSKREAAMSIHVLGHSAEEMVAGRATESGLQQRLSEITNQVVLQAVNHRAYPVLHFFHSARVEGSFTVQLARLDEALTLWECLAHPEDRLPRSIVEPLRRAVEEYLVTVEPLCHSEVETPQPRDPAWLGRQLAQPVDSAAYTQALEEQKRRRRSLRAAVEAHGWDWSLVARTPSDGAVNQATVHQGVGDLSLTRP